MSYVPRLKVLYNIPFIYISYFDIIAFDTNEQQIFIPESVGPERKDYISGENVFLILTFIFGEHVLGHLITETSDTRMSQYPE